MWLQVTDKYLKAVLYELGYQCQAWVRVQLSNALNIYTKDTEIGPNINSII